MTSAASNPALQNPSPAPRQSTLRLFVAFFAVLLLVLLLNGGLTLAALHKVQFESTTAAVRMVGHDWALRIQGAISFGKPIEQFYGLKATLTQIQKDLPAVASVAVTNAQGVLIQSVGQAPVRDDLATSVRRTLAASKPVVGKLQGRHYLVFPIQGREGQMAGALTMTVHEATITQAVSEHLGRNVLVLALVALLAALVLLAGLSLLRISGGASGMGTQSRWRLFALPIVVVVLAQGVYSWDSIHTFRQQYLGAVQETAKIAVQRLGRDFQRLFDKGVHIERLVGIEAPFKRVMDEAAEIGYMEIQAADGAVLYRVDREGRLEKRPPALPLDSALDLTTAFHVAGGPQIGSLRVHLDGAAIAAGARQRLLDAGTVVLLSILWVIELFVLLGVLMRRQPPAVQPANQPQPTPSDDGRHVLGRPTAFLLLLAWALPLSFIPLRMREIYTPILGLSEHVVLALPLSVEMLCALVTALVAGALTDRRGWHVPFLAGVVISLAGALFSSAADNVWTFMMARALVGAGYGLAWMGIQGFIVLWATPQTRAQGMAHLVAGIFAGHICGSAVGAMLAQQVGYTTVFLFSAALSLLPGLFVLMYMRPYFGLPASMGAPAVQPSRKLDWPSVRQLLGDRNFALLMLGSVVPFSVAQVGLLYFTLPLFLVDQGVSQSSIGRIMMIYGLSVIYLGPFLGRYVDASHSKKKFIVLGGLVGSLGMIYLFFDNSLFAITLSVFALGLASSLAGAAQSAFALNLHAVQEMGMGKAMGVQRAADKLGQMIGPLLIGALFASVGAASGLAITGLLYLGATVLFLLLAQPPRPLGAASA